VVRAKRHWGKWVFRVLGCFCLLGIGALLFKDWQVSRDIKREEDLLLAMGIDVRELDPRDDARKDYKVIANSLKGAFSSGNSQRALEQLESAAKKPGMSYSQQAITAGPPIGQHDDTRDIIDITLWIMKRAREAAASHDWAMLERLFRLETRMFIQIRAAQNNAFDGMTVSAGPAPLGYLADADSETRAWLRRKLESFDKQPLVRAQLSGIGKYARRLIRDSRITSVPSGSASSLQAWWAKSVESQTLFRQSAMLEFLRQWREVVAAKLKSPADETRTDDCFVRLRLGLSRRTSWPAAWAERRVFASMSYSSASQSWNTKLIELDLRDQRDQGAQAPQPIWSKKYCVDPDTRNPITVTADQGGFKMWTSMWASESSW
jgi:hypothetical protein